MQPTPGLPMHVYLCCLPSSVSTLRCSARESSNAANSVTSYARLPVLSALLCLHATVLRQGVLQGSQLRGSLCTVTCVACPPLSPRYGVPPGSPSVQPNSLISYARLPVLHALLCLHATMLRQGVLQCSQTP
jgi:hypothetical protein